MTCAASPISAQRAARKGRRTGAAAESSGASLGRVSRPSTPSARASSRRLNSSAPHASSCARSASSTDHTIELLPSNSGKSASGPCQEIAATRCSDARAPVPPWPRSPAAGSRRRAAQGRQHSRTADRAPSAPTTSRAVSTAPSLHVRSSGVGIDVRRGADRRSSRATGGNEAVDAGAHAAPRSRRCSRGWARRCRRRRSTAPPRRRGARLVPHAHALVGAQARAIEPLPGAGRAQHALAGARERHHAQLRRRTGVGRGRRGDAARPTAAMRCGSMLRARASSAAAQAPGQAAADHHDVESAAVGS